MAPGGIGSRWPRHQRKAQSIAAASATRISTSVNGFTVASAISMKKKEPPQSTERKSRIAQSSRFIACPAP